MSGIPGTAQKISSRELTPGPVVPEFFFFLLEITLITRMANYSWRQLPIKCAAQDGQLVIWVNIEYSRVQKLSPDIPYTLTGPARVSARP